MNRSLVSKRFYQVGGTLSVDAPSYIPRRADQELLEHVTAGDFCYILTPRQMGKSSLVVRTFAQLKKKRIHSVLIDLQGKIEHGMTAEAFYAGLLDTLRKKSVPLWQQPGYGIKMRKASISSSIHRSFRMRHGTT